MTAALTTTMVLGGIVAFRRRPYLLWRPVGVVAIGAAAFPLLIALTVAGFGIGDLGSKHYKTTPEDLAELRLYALDIINRERAKHGVATVKLGDNGAAQLHAEDALKHGILGHWTSDGMKPYMTYARVGGVGVVAETASASDCRFRLLCLTRPITEDIATSLDGMIYDNAHADWGHRDTILSPDFDRVNLGVAFGRTGYRYYQHFEYVGVEYLDNPRIDDTTLKLRFKPLDGNRVSGIEVYYDTLPRPMSASQIWKLNSYCVGGGATDTCVPPAFVLRHGLNDDIVDVAVTLGTSGLAKGVYTVVIWSAGDDEKVLSEYAIFKD